jgi:hypothetical protein
MKSLRHPIAALAAFCLMSAVAIAAADPSGTWKWTTQGRGGSGGGGGTPRESTLTLAVKDGKVTGKISSPGRGGDPSVTEIKNAAIKGDTVSFTVERQFGDNKIVQKYSGKIAGDTITCTVESPGRDGGQPTPREWVAKRAK